MAGFLLFIYVRSFSIRLLKLVQAGAGTEHLAFAVDVEMVVIKELIIPSCCPVQVDVANLATIGPSLVKKLG